MNEVEAAGHGFLADPHTWVYVGFLIFVVLVGPKLWKALAQMLDRRSLKIKSDLDEAQKLKDEAQALLAEYQRKQRDAMREAEEIISNAKGAGAAPDQGRRQEAGREPGAARKGLAGKDRPGRGPGPRRSAPRGGGRRDRGGRPGHPRPDRRRRAAAP